jgi:hypothetical protein
VCARPSFFVVVSFIFSFHSVSFLNLVSKKYRVLQKSLNLDLKICNFLLIHSLCSTYFCVHGKRMFVMVAVPANVYSIITELFPITCFCAHRNILCVLMFD